METEGQNSGRGDKWWKLLEERTGLERTGGGKAEGVGGRQGDTREEAVGIEIGSASGDGLERVSTMTFSKPGICTTELVNSAK